MLAFASLNLNLSADGVTDSPRGALVSENCFPLLNSSYVDGLSVAGSDEETHTSLRIVAPRFFETMQIRRRVGRDFSPRDRKGAPRVAIVNETLARTVFGAQSPLGRHIGAGIAGGAADIEIVGVIADTKYGSLREAIPNTVYLPLGQTQAGSERTLHVRTSGEPAAFASHIREQVRTLDPNLPVSITLFSEVVNRNLLQERLLASFSGFFGSLALLLTAVGLYGVIAYSTQRRTREIGVRMALGADQMSVRWMVLCDCLLLVGVGVAGGLPASFWLSRHTAAIRRLPGRSAYARRRCCPADDGGGRGRICAGSTGVADQSDSRAALRLRAWRRADSK